MSLKALISFTSSRLPWASLNWSKGTRKSIRNIVVDTVVDDPVLYAIEIHDLLTLIVGFGRSVQQFGAGGAKVGTAARRGIVAASGGRGPRMEIFGLRE